MPPGYYQFWPPLINTNRFNSPIKIVTSLMVSAIINQIWYNLAKIHAGREFDHASY